VYYIQASLTWLQPVDSVVLFIGANSILWASSSVLGNSHFVTIISYALILYFAIGTFSSAVTIPWNRLLKPTCRPESEGGNKGTGLLTTNEMVSKASEVIAIFQQHWLNLKAFRRSNPAKFAVEACLVFTCLAAVGGSVSGYFFIFIPMNLALVLPGLHYRGHLQKLLAHAGQDPVSRLRPHLLKAQQAAQRLSALIDKQLQAHGLSHHAHAE